MGSILEFECRIHPERWGCTSFNRNFLLEKSSMVVFRNTG